MAGWRLDKSNFLIKIIEDGGSEGTGVIVVNEAEKSS